jgi:hypothetical protein
MASDITELLLKLLHQNYSNNMCVTCACYITYISTNMDKLLTSGWGSTIYYSVEISGYLL